MIIFTPFPKSAKQYYADKYKHHISEGCSRSAALMRTVAAAAIDGFVTAGINVLLVCLCVIVLSGWYRLLAYILTPLLSFIS